VFSGQSLIPIRNQRTLLRIGPGCCAARCLYFCDQLTDGRIGVAHFEAHGAAATVNQKDLMRSTAMRIAAPISFVPVLRKTTRRAPSIAGGVKRMCQSFLGGYEDKTSAVNRHE